MRSKAKGGLVKMIPIDHVLKAAFMPPRRKRRWLSPEEYFGNPEERLKGMSNGRKKSKKIVNTIVIKK